MVSRIIPKILFNQHFWWIVWLVVLVAIFFARRKSPPPFPRTGIFLKKFFKKHENSILKIGNIFLICIILLWSYILLPFVWDNFRNPIESESTRTFIQKLGLMGTFNFLTVWAGVSGFFVGNLSIFQSNLTKIKRIILLIVCLLPIVFTILHVINDLIEIRLLAVQICIYSSALSWIINMPAVLTGKSFTELIGNILKKLKLIPSHHAS